MCLDNTFHLIWVDPLTISETDDVVGASPVELYAFLSRMRRIDIFHVPLLQTWESGKDALA